MLKIVSRQTFTLVLEFLQRKWVLKSHFDKVANMQNMNNFIKVKLL